MGGTARQVLRRHPHRRLLRTRSSFAHRHARYGSTLHAGSRSHMDLTTSIHDHHIRDLTVNAAERTIRVRTAYPESAGPDGATVVFEDVQGYVFRGDALGTILFEIELVDPFELYREHSAEMQRVYADAGGHAAWAENESSAA